MKNKFEILCAFFIGYVMCDAVLCFGDHPGLSTITILFLMIQMFIILFSKSDEKIKNVS